MRTAGPVPRLRAFARPTRVSRAGHCARSTEPSPPRVRGSAAPGLGRGVHVAHPALGGHPSTRLSMSTARRRRSGQPRRPEECEEWPGRGRRSWWAVPEPVPAPAPFPADRCELAEEGPGSACCGPPSAPHAPSRLLLDLTPAGGGACCCPTGQQRRQNHCDCLQRPIALLVFNVHFIS